MRYLSRALQVLPRHRQRGDKHGDAAQHEHGAHQAAHASQQDGPESIMRNMAKWRDFFFFFSWNFKDMCHLHLACVSDSYLCLWSSRTSNQMLQRITPHASAIAKAHGILGTLGGGGGLKRHFISRRLSDFKVKIHSPVVKGPNERTALQQPGFVLENVIIWGLKARSCF